jgi:tetratricopeptide (TPR) repeat protein
MKKTLKTCLVPSLVLAPLAFSLAGCGEMATYSKQSRDRGYEYLQTRQYTEAEGAFRDAVRQNPRDFRSHYYLGRLAERQGQYISAITSYKTSLAVQPLSLDAEESGDFRHQTLIDLGKCLAKADTRDSEINALAAEAPKDASGEKNLILANAFVARGDADSAIAAYTAAEKQNPKSFDIAKEAGLYFEQIGQKPLAEASLRRAYRLKDDDEKVNNALRRLGIVPGPALKAEDELVKPLLPRGPIPEIMPERRPALPAPQAPAPGRPAE